MSSGTVAQTSQPAKDLQRDSPTSPEPRELDEFGLPQRPVTPRPPPADSSDSEDEDENDSFHDAEADATATGQAVDQQEKIRPAPLENESHEDPSESQPRTRGDTSGVTMATDKTSTSPSRQELEKSLQDQKEKSTNEHDKEAARPPEAPTVEAPTSSDPDPALSSNEDASPKNSLRPSSPAIAKRESRLSGPAVSEWSHQRQITKPESDDEEEIKWQAMPAIDEFDIFDDNGRLVAKGNKEDAEASNAYSGIGGAGKGYTRVQLDEDAQSATSMDEDTNYLFQSGAKDKSKDEDNIDEFEDQEQRDALTQLKATKDLLTEGQRIAYVGVVRLTIHKMFQALTAMETTRSTKKEIGKALESMDKWGQKMMVRLYAHMEISVDEQMMIEQLAEHGVQPSDLSSPLMLNARVKNPMAKENKSELEIPSESSDRNSTSSRLSSKSEVSLKEPANDETVPEVHGPSDMPRSRQIELDLRWTVLCDLFLVLISDSEYDSRSRRLLERVGSTMDINWVQICRFEKRVIDSLEMQEAEAKENWDETDNMERRRKLGLKRKYVVMGLATVGGGLVIGLSAGLLAPVIGAGLAAGFTTIGVGGTAGFLGGVGGAALITSGATLAGGTIAVRASDRRTGHVKTFEYRPLHNHKRLNLILTIAGWMNGKVDDVRLPYSTVDPIMGDIYSLLWEPEMLQSMGDTINILATEALTQTVQQVLGSTILVALMASIQLPVVLSKLAYLIDNPWSVSLDRANAAGLILADSLIDRHLGQRPITLVGFSLGSRVIFTCLKELSNRAAYGLIQNVYLFGSPVVVKKDEYLRARSVVSGRFLNGYASNDWILGYLFRATSGGIMRVAGLAPVEGIPGIENMDVSKFVNGHMAYRTAMPRLMREAGWEVESDEFSEIEDPDPENHAQRQRELIQEIDEARKKAEEKPEKKRFGLFKRGKLAEKKGWETYNLNENDHKRSQSGGGKESDTSKGGDLNVLFDIDAIRKELESEMIEVRELNSTLPPMQITSYARDGEKQVEYLRLPPDLKPEEVARMNLPPRPDDIDVSIGPLRPARTSSLQPMPRAYSPQVSPRLSPQRSPRESPQRPLNASPATARRLSYNYTEPKELVSTLPPLALTPSPRLDSQAIASTTARPEVKQHAVDPAPTGWNSHSTINGGCTPTLQGLNLEHNAWADDDDDFGQKREGNISMTFE
ncbi:uncharacterized protein A1O9_12247 [Exophiala aquamarina CBS 119918]|uniref:DUF726 domain protein n=1 Tax=Exophiala aquamarina CBS 119918 TaxID=1182545 RepID=A0A072NW21_9EURO|nr:uncharacterized protein A1O9_12247 [Exophiala aquamarina CBS 119918]KEF51612.1 hypothetical protein A1O9_12247 [Exophiala aquamarina CBS 119918]